PPGGGVGRGPARAPVPAVGRGSVVSTRKVVLFPAPWGPSKPTIPPVFTVRPPPRTASTDRFLVLNVRASPCASIITVLLRQARPCQRPARRVADLAARQAGPRELGISYVLSRFQFKLYLVTGELSSTSRSRLEVLLTR